MGPGGAEGGRAPIESRIYRVKFLKIGKISSFLLLSTVQYYNEKMKYKTVNRVNKLYALLSVTYRLVIDSRLVNTTIRKANQLNYVIEDVEFVLNLAMDEMGRGVGPGGPRGPGFPLESRIHRVKFLKIGKISSFLLLYTAV